MAGRYTYPCPGCGTRQEAQASGVFGEAPPHRLCAACEYEEQHKKFEAETQRFTPEGAKSKR